MIPARAAVPAPSRGGGSIWRELRTGPAVFFLLFILVGIALAALGVWGRFVAPPERAESMADPAFYLAAMAFGGVFILVAFAMMRIVLTAQAASRRLGERPAGQGPPWTWDHPWRPDAMGPDYETRGSSTLGTLAVLSLIALFNIALGTAPWLFKIIISGVRRLRSADSLQLGDDPHQRRTIQAADDRVAHVSGALRPAVGGHGPVRRPIDATGPASVTLRCLRDTPRHVHAEHEGPAEAGVDLPRDAPVRLARTLSSLAIAFQVPSDLPGTDLGREEAVYWQVVVQVPVSGPDFQGVFLAPVYAVGVTS